MARKDYVNRRPTRGRPAKEIDWDKVDRLLEAGCLGTEIAANIGISVSAFYARTEQDKGMNFSQYLQLKRSKGDSLLRVKQFKKAMDGDNVMLLWLGKNRLNQKEQHDHNVSVVIQPVNYADADIDNDDDDEEDYSSP